MGAKKIKGEATQETAEASDEGKKKRSPKAAKAYNPNSKLMTVEQFQLEYVPWSEQTIRRRIREEGFPGIDETGGLLIPRDECDLWFKRRRIREQR